MQKIINPASSRGALNPHRKVILMPFIPRGRATRYSGRGWIKYILIFIGAVVAAVLIFLFVGAPAKSEPQWGVSFSQKYARDFGFEWKNVYTTILEDLGAKKIKLSTHWDLLEPNKDNFSFDDLDWQINLAQKNNAKLLLAVGMKTPRWPECHIPTWAAKLDKTVQQQEILKLLTAIVTRYKASPAIWAWQVENEPLFTFGECPWKDKNFLKQEVTLVKQLDPSRPIVISDSGEWSLWLEAAKIGDIVGTTLYRKVWFTEISAYFTYPFPPIYYWRKAWLIKKLFHKNVINIELQAEPWGSKPPYLLSATEQEQTMSPERFNDVIDFARKTGLSEYYFWGTEWWYWMKEKQNTPFYWDTAKKILSSR